MDKIVEPSEIIDKGDFSQERSHTPPNPWIRFLARFFDYSLFFTAIRLLILSFQPHFSFRAIDSFVPVEFLAWVPLEALLLSTWGTTPGKWLLHIQMRFGRTGKPDFKLAFRRSILVWIRGLGLAIPFINLFCFLVAYNRLKLTQTTSWDRDLNIHVSYAPIHRWRIGLAASVAVLGLLFYYLPF